MARVVRKLRILVIDDNDPDTCIELIRSLLIACLGDKNFRIDTPLTYLEGESHLTSGRPYDLVLLDLRLDKEHRWGGCELLDRHWQSIQANGSKIILYSGKPDAIEAFESFSSGRGPFLFYSKASASEPGEGFGHHVVRLLRDRVKALCQRASLNSAVAVIKSNVPEVLIDGEAWSVDSLLAPWTCPLPGEAARERESIVRSLFPSNNLVRVLSYWFKGQAFMWPNDAMYGLSPLAPYHLGATSGPLDALMHAPNLPHTPPRFPAAAQTALDDLESLGLRLTAPFAEYLREYLTFAKEWTDIGTLEASRVEECKDSVMFRLSDVKWIFESEGAEIETSRIPRWDLIGEYEFYSPATYTSLDNGLGRFHPSLKYAASRLAQSVKERANGVWSVAFDVEGELVSFNRPTDFPFLVIAVCHAGTPFGDAPSIIASFNSGTGRALHDASEALQGCAHWYILSGENGRMHAYEAPSDPGTLRSEDANELWDRFNKDGIWHVIHVLKVGMPTVKP